MATTDLPAPPLVEKTVMTRPSSPSASITSGTAGTGAAMTSPEATRATASASWAGSIGACSTSLTPERSARWSISVDSSLVTMMAPTSRRAASSCSTAASSGLPANDGPRTITTGMDPSREARSLMEAKGVAPWPELHGQAAARRLVGIDHGHRHLAAAAPGGGAGARMWHVLAGLAGERAGHDLGPAVPLGP